MPMKTALKIKTTPKIDIPQKNTPKNVEDLSEIKRTSKYRHILRVHYGCCRTSLKCGLNELESRVQKMQIGIVNYR